MLLFSLALSVAHADPCGMVPPIRLDGVAPVLERQGIQRTYLLHHDGVETMVLRPGFVGDVESFGMLIPFPTPPELRKIDDDTFQHVEGAMDPPDIAVHLYEPYDYDDFPMMMRGMVEESEMEGAEAPMTIAIDEVRVVKQEAIGMYQVAVLEAGSAKALSGWMGDNGYQYPEGMDGVVEDYVASRWAFVAIKANVGAALGVEPHPGMRSTDPTRPKGSSFDGHVQGMGFRFPVEEPVVPMRLSVFNGEDPHNVVYMITDQPVRIDKIDEGLVLQQLTGAELHANLTRPLKVHYENGGANDLYPHDMEYLQSQRHPERWNGIARDLIASDLLAIKSGQLSLPFEEEEKELLRINEALGIRGDAADVLLAGEVAAQRAEAVDGALDDLKELNVSVIDGVFPQELLAAENLSFVPYKRKGPQPQRQDPLRPADLSFSFQKKG